jgi:uncharacterized membrane protein
MIVFFLILMILVVIGIAVIHGEVKTKVENDERIINRLDLIIKEWLKTEISA